MPSHGPDIPIFPILARDTVGIEIVKTPNFHTRKQRAVSGRTLTSADQRWPIWHWTLTYELLRDNYDIRILSGIFSGYNDALRVLMSFVNQRLGAAQPFLFFDPTDCFAGYPDGSGFSNAQFLATGDGSTKRFQLYRQLGSIITFTLDGTATRGLMEPVYAAIYDNDATLLTESGLSSAPFKVYADGIEVSSSDYVGISFSGSDPYYFGNAIYAIEFDTAPAAGVKISAGFYFFHVAKFAMDSQEFKNFLASRWGLKELKFESQLVGSPLL